MERKVSQEVYELLESEGDERFSHELLGWLHREPEINANVIIVAADWDGGTVTVFDGLDGDWSATMSIEEFRSIVKTHMIAASLRANGETLIAADHADDLRDDYGVRVQDLEGLGSTEAQKRGPPGTRTLPAGLKVHRR